MNDATNRVVAASAPLDLQRSFYVGLFWRAGFGLALLVGIAFAIAPWIVHGRAIAIVAAASCASGALASILVARLLHGRRLALRLAVATVAALVAGGVALYLVELPAALFVAVQATVDLLLGLLFYRAEDVARTRAVDERWRATFELVGGMVVAVPRWLMTSIRRDD